MHLLDGDAVLLAGATGRVGGATLATFVHEGARVLVVSRSAERAQATIDALLDDTERAAAMPFAADLADSAQAAAAVAACVERFGRIDALVSLAGDGHVVRLIDSSLDDLRTNLVAFTETAYSLALPALRAMLAQQPRPGTRSRGRMVVVTAGSSKQPAPGRGLFGIAKAGVNVLMQAIAREHKGDGIVANALVRRRRDRRCARLSEPRGLRRRRDTAGSRRHARVPGQRPRQRRERRAGRPQRARGRLMVQIS
ncbi:MAG: SDR family oxidoreductase [Candidatus Eremiobacteraeota bacterium]|nr:SDR family oxidoreductase [Candidatus Eremiobacteraeota bacterium]